MKILMVLNSHFPPDSRVEKEAISLLEEGHEVHIICYLKHDQKNKEKFQSITIHRINCSDFFINKLSALALIYPYYFKKWKKEIEKIFIRHQFDAIHVHDLPLSKVGYYFKKKFGCKLICDQHEFYSDWIKRTAHMNTLTGKLVSKFSNWGKYEKKYLSLANLVITVAEPLRINYIKKYKLDADKIITVPNTPTRKIYNLNNINNEIIERYKNDFIIFYAGGIDILRGIDTAIIALKSIQKEIPNAKILLCGRIVHPYDPIKTAKKYGVESSVIFNGWINEEELPSYIAASNVCFFTPPANREEINNTIATKIYQFAIMQKPIIVSDAKLMKEFVVNNNLGISVKTGDNLGFANAVLNIAKNKNLFQKSSSNIGEEFFWERTVNELITSYSLLNSKQQ
ncbi:glycosyltransferase [Mariniphaga sp.]|uniref:glycosyltransferase n=1 Tax=Mariniphaga sp. TaxID=1954475 RepID=UPI00356564A5